MLSAKTNHIGRLSTTTIIHYVTTLVAPIGQSRHGDWVLFRAFAVAHSLVALGLVTSLGTRALATAIKTALQATSLNRIALCFCPSYAAPAKPSGSTA